MELADIVAITGMPGLYKIAARRNDGIIVTSLIDNKTQFVSGRNHLFTTLDNITIYTQEDTTPLKEVIAEVKKQEASNPLPDGKDDAKLKTWFETILPTYDREKVYISDIKKLVKWYSILDAQKLIEELTAEKAVEETKEEETTEQDEKTDKKAAAKKGAKDEKPKKEAKPKTTGVKKDTGKATSRTAAPAKKITTPRKAS
jgi:hypothetical protein